MACSRPGITRWAIQCPPHPHLPSRCRRRPTSRRLRPTTTLARCIAGRRRSAVIGAAGSGSRPSPHASLRAFRRHLAWSRCAGPHTAQHPAPSAPPLPPSASRARRGQRSRPAQPAQLLWWHRVSRHCTRPCCRKDSALLLALQQPAAAHSQLRRPLHRSCRGSSRKMEAAQQASPWQQEPSSRQQLKLPWQPIRVHSLQQGLPWWQLPRWWISQPQHLQYMHPPAAPAAAAQPRCTRQPRTAAAS